MDHRSGSNGFSEYLGAFILFMNGDMKKRLRYTASFFENFVDARFSCGGWCIHIFRAPAEAEDGTYVAAQADWLFWNHTAKPLLGDEGSTSPPRWLLTAARIAVQEVGESPPNTRRSRPALNDDPSLCATPYTTGGVGEHYQRRSTLF
jgi:hypothetical protein